MAPPVAGYIAWWDASAITGVADGASLASWPDLSGNGHDLSQATGASQPIFYKTTTAKLINGLPAVWFSAQNMSAAAIGQSQPFTVVFVAQNTDTASQRTPFASASTTVYLQRQSAQGGAWVARAGTNFITTLLPATAAHAVLFVYNGASSIGRQDATEQTPSTGDPSTGALSGGFTVGASNTGSNGWIGPICEMIVYPSGLNSTDRDSVISYLNSKWLVASTPSGTASLPLGPVATAASGMPSTPVTASLPLGPLATSSSGTPSWPTGYANCNLGPLAVAVSGTTGACTRRAWLTLGSRFRWLQDEDAGYFCTSLDLGYPVVREVVSNRPNMDGTIDRTQYVAGRAVTAAITAIAGAGATIDQVAADFAPFMSPAARPVLHYVLDRAPGIERTLTLRGVAYSWPIVGPFQRDIQLSWVAPDPIARDPNVKTVSASPVSVGTISSPGDVAVLPLLRLYGPITGPVITLAPSDLGTWYLAFAATFTVGSGHWVDIDTSARSALRDGDPAKPVLSFFDWTRTTWQSVPPAPSSTNLSLAGTATTTATRVDATWQDGYLT